MYATPEALLHELRGRQHAGLPPTWRNKPANEKSGNGHGPLNRYRSPTLLISNRSPHHEGAGRKKAHVERQAAHPPRQRTAGTEIGLHIRLAVAHGKPGHQYAYGKNRDNPVIKRGHYMLLFACLLFAICLSLASPLHPLRLITPHGEQ